MFNWFLNPPACRCIDRKVNYSLEDSWPSEGRLQEERPSVLRTQRITANRSLWLRDATGDRTAYRNRPESMLSRGFQKKKTGFEFSSDAPDTEGERERARSERKRLADCWNAHKVHIVHSVCLKLMARWAGRRLHQRRQHVSPLSPFRKDHKMTALLIRTVT